MEKQPYEVLDSSFNFQGRGSSTVQAKIRNLIDGSVLTKTFHAGDEFEEAEIEKKNAKFVYSHKDKFVFHEENKPSVRFELLKEAIGDSAGFLKQNETVEAIMFEGKLVNIFLPIKVQLRIKEAPPGIRGDRAQGGTKIAILETGTEINVPLFVEAGDIIEINTETGQYVKRVE